MYNFHSLTFTHFSFFTWRFLLLLLILLRVDKLQLLNKTHWDVEPKRMSLTPSKEDILSTVSQASWQSEPTTGASCHAEPPPWGILLPYPILDFIRVPCTLVPNPTQLFFLLFVTIVFPFRARKLPTSWNSSWRMSSLPSCNWNLTLLSMFQGHHLSPGGHNLLTGLPASALGLLQLPFCNESENNLFQRKSTHTPT